MRNAATRNIVIAAAVFAVIALAALAWRVIGPGPMAFAQGTKVALSDYRAADPTGVPADLVNADAVKRGEYLARAADCMVCHTAPDGEKYAGGLAFPLPFGTLFSTNITPDKGMGIGNYSDQDFLDAVQRGIRRDGAPLSGDAVYFLYLHDQCGRPGDQGLSLQSRSGARSQSLEYADLPVQSALVDALLVAIFQCKRPLRVRLGAKPGMEPRGLSRRGTSLDISHK
jgi:hypothetical protein